MQKPNAVQRGRSFFNGKINSLQKVGGAGSRANPSIHNLRRNRWIRIQSACARCAPAFLGLRRIRLSRSRPPIDGRRKHFLSLEHRAVVLEQELSAAKDELSKARDNFDRTVKERYEGKITIEGKQKTGGMTIGLHLEGPFVAEGTTTLK